MPRGAAFGARSRYKRVLKGGVLPLSQTVKIALIQTSCSEDPVQNLEKSLARVREAAGKGAQIIGLQELFRSRYFCREEDPKHFDLAEPFDGPSVSAFSKLAKDANVVVICPIFEKRTGGIYHNSVAVIDAGGEVVGKYRKMHIPHDPHFYEKYYFTPGDLGFRVFDTKYGRIASLICWDQWFPEGARLAALAGAQILYYPTAIGWLQGESDEDRRGMRDAWRSSSRPRTASAPKKKSSSGEAASSSIRWAAFSRAAAKTKKSFTPSATSPRLKRRAARGRSCATGASMLMADS